MTTQINVIVDNGGLSAKAKQQTQANRWSKLEGDNRQKVQATGTQQRDANRAQQGIGPDGRPLYGTPPAQPLRRDEPAASRFGVDETLAMSWIVVTANSWRFRDINYPTEKLTHFEGTNQGRSIYLSSTDGTYWLSLTNISELRAPADFAPGMPTGLGDMQQIQRSCNGSNNYEFDLFPVGNGNFIVTFRFALAYNRGGWTVTELPTVPPSDVYEVSSNIRPPFTTIYRSFLVSKSAVREIATPTGVEDYFGGKFPTFVPATLSLREYVGFPPVMESRTSPDPAKTLKADWGFINTFGIPNGNNNFFGRYDHLWWLNGWWQKAMPVPSGSLPANSRLILGSPAVFSRATNAATNWSNYFSSYDSSGVVTNNFSSWFSWFAASYVQDQQKMKKPLAYYLASYSSLYSQPMAISLPVYQAITAQPSGYSWFSGINPRIDPSDQMYWKPFKTLTFSQSAVPMPSVSAVVSDDCGWGPDKHFCVTTDWGNPAYCRQQLLALGFSSSDLTP